MTLQQRFSIDHFCSCCSCANETYPCPFLYRLYIYFTFLFTGVPEGRWVYNVAGSSDPTINNGARCRNIALRKSIQEKVWEQSRGFEPCPCTLAQAWRDRRFRPAGRENNVHKFRSTFAFGLLAKRRLCNYKYVSLSFLHNTVELQRLEH